MRSTTMLTEELYQLIGIGPDLGVIIFIPVPQENLAMYGSVVGNELSKVEQQDNPGFMKTLGQSISRRHFKSSSGGTSDPLSPSSIKSPTVAQTLQSAPVDDDIAAVERRRQLGMKKSVSNFVRRGLGRASKEKEEQQDPERVEIREPAKPKKDDRVLRFEDEL
jgi:hypothetical protein